MNKIQIPPLDHDAEEKAISRQKILAKPPCSLGKLEPLAIRLASMTGNPTPKFENKAVILFSSDHDIAKHGLSLTSQDVTHIMTQNFLTGGATINSFAVNAGARLTIVDIGTYGEFNDHPNLIKSKIMEGANDFSEGPAMTREEAIACIQAGIDVTRKEISKGLDLVAPGEMGIGNTTPSSAIISVLTGIPVETVTGKGSGIKSETILRKIELINKGIALNKPDPNDAIGVLSKVGGPEIGAMAGLMLAAASNRIPIVIDGFIAGAAAAIAKGINPDVIQYFVGSHSSAEPGHSIIMKHIGVETYLDLGLCLGEGTGAALFFPIIDATARTLSDIKTLPDLGIPIP